MKESLNISVITNFGCRANCWYCIWKGHKLENIQLETDWDKLENFLIAHKDKGKVSISGGGDCLYRYDFYKFWWVKFFSIANKLNLKVDIHTREKFTDIFLWRHINRCVFSSDNLQEDLWYLLWLSGLANIRITHLVTENTTDKMIEEYLEFQKQIKCQFTIKELIGFDDNGRYKEIRKKYPQIYNLDAGDYNIYYMPDNTIANKFLE